MNRSLVLMVVGTYWMLLLMAVDVVIDVAAPHHSIVSKVLSMLSRWLPESIVNGLCDINHCNMIPCVTQIERIAWVDHSDGSNLKMLISYSNSSLVPCHVC